MPFESMSERSGADLLVLARRHVGQRQRVHEAPRRGLTPMADEIRLHIARERFLPLRERARDVPLDGQGGPPAHAFPSPPRTSQRWTGGAPGFTA